MEQVENTDGRKNLATLPVAELLRACRAGLCATPKRGTMKASRLGALLIEGENGQVVVRATNSAVLSQVRLGNVPMGVRSFRVAVDANALVSRLNHVVGANPAAVVTLYVYDENVGQKACHTYDGFVADAESQYGCPVFFGFGGDSWFGVQDESANYPNLPDMDWKYGSANGEGRVNLTLEELERLVKSARAAKADVVTLTLHGEVKPVHAKGLSKDCQSVMWEGLIAPTRVH